MDKIIITAAITGAIHIPTMTPYLPQTPEEIANEAIKAGEAGASVVHIHMRDPNTGAPSSDPNLFRESLTIIKQNSDIIICTTTGGGLGTTAEERIRVVPTFKPEMASFNMGSMNFALHPIAKAYATFKYPWEKPYLEMTKDLVFKNTFADLELFCKTMYENGTKPEMECYDVGQLYNAAQLVREGILKPPLHIQFVMGVLGGIGTSVEDLLHMHHTADQLFGKLGYTWSTIGAGRHEFPLCSVAAILGGHVRVGLEDNIYLRKDVLAKSNAELVEKIAHITYELTGKEPATPAETRKILELKGKDKVNF
jgi:uncharacterized protein (DUF849 family)